MFITVNFGKISLRGMSRYLGQDRTSKAIRKTFLEYFINEHSHNFIRSSPVVPYCDPTVAFVNAGMNQFKGIFLGRQEPKYTKVTNSQKCIRVGGRHNDLDIVGTDGYHHTFFEMLGNWSFGEYFKKEACQLAWNFLTEVYKINPACLYVTYFSGDKKLGISEDRETKEIWQSLGVSEDRILPFGVKDNFWEMGLTGPCGPCTEIHVDYLGKINRAQFVNKGLHDLTELWNIVFIQYSRNTDGTITALPKHHVDTGMGFERLTTFLQGRISNYDTDNFLYLFKAIKRICSAIEPYNGLFGESDWNELDKAYRVLADHTRMITVCLGDGMIPEENQKLRRIMRKVFYLSETTFKKPNGLLKELSNYVVENLGSVYGELEKNIKQIHQIIDFEEDVYKQIRQTASDEWSKLVKENPKLLALDIIETPSVVTACKEIKNAKLKNITSQTAFKFYDSFGLDEETLTKLSKILKLKFDREGFIKLLNSAKFKSKAQSFITNNVIYDKLIALKRSKTDSSKKYDYTKKNGKYKFNDLKVKVVDIVKDLDIIPKLSKNVYSALVLNQTNLYSDAGGQISDRGLIKFGSNKIFQITETQDCNGFILHKGFLNNGTIKTGDEGCLQIDTKFRLQNMQNHTGVHLLNAVIKEIKGTTCQKSSKVTDNFLNLDVGIFNNKIDLPEIDVLEKRLLGVIKNSLNVTTKEIDSNELLTYDYVTMIPGEIYPDTGIRLVEIKNDDGFISREPCCGTHVLNTGDLEDFCVINLKSLGRSTASIHAVTGERAKLAKKNASEIGDTIETFEKSVKDNIDKPEVLNMAINALKQKLNYEIESDSILPVTVKQQCLDKLNNISKQVKDTSKENLKEFIEIEMKNALESNDLKTRKNQKYMVHYLRSSMVLESVPLQKATKMCPDMPVLIISYSDNMVKARCCVPKGFVSAKFNAELWLKETVGSIFHSQVAPPKGQDGALVCNMKGKKVNIEEWHPLLNESLEAAKKYIEERL